MYSSRGQIWTVIYASLYLVLLLSYSVRCLFQFPSRIVRLLPGIYPLWRNQIAWAPFRVLHVTRLRILTIVIFIAINIFCICIKTSNLSTLSNRCALLAMINILPLIVGERSIALSGIFYIRIDTLKVYHRTIGAITAIEVAVHIGSGAFIDRRRIREDICAVYVGKFTCSLDYILILV